MLEETMTRSPVDASRTRNDLIAEWFLEWRKRIRCLLRKRSSVPPADIDDLAQEVFLRLLDYSDATAIENPAAYLSRVAANVANQWCDRARVRHPHSDRGLAELPIESKDEPEVSVALAQRDRCIQAALGELPPRRREVLLLRLQHGMTLEEIAQERGLTYRIVVREITRAYGALRLQLKPEDL